MYIDKIILSIYVVGKLVQSMFGQTPLMSIPRLCNECMKCHV